MPDLDSRTAVYTGSFDPITLGHMHVIERAAGLYDQLIVGVGVNATKQSLFSLQERIALLEEVTADFGNVIIESFDDLAVDFVRRRGARVMVRGVRPLTDIAAEFTMMMANRQLDSEIETVFLMADEQFGHISSTLIKQIAAMSSDSVPLLKFVPEPVIEPLVFKMRNGKS